MKDKKTLQTLIHIVSLMDNEAIKDRLLSEMHKCMTYMKMEEIYEETKNADV